ncbi:unnamed protein product [Camellia sinensis]
MAEGFISQEDRREEETLMDVAERFLGELAQRCMIQVELKPEEYSTDRGSSRFLYCRLHDLMRDLCLARRKTSFKSLIIDIQMSKCISPLHRWKPWLVPAVAVKYIDLPSMKIRTVATFTSSIKKKEIGTFCQFHSSTLVGYGGRWWISAKRNRKTNAFEVLGVGNTKFTKLPSTIGNLKYLETVDLRTNSEISVPNVLWKMEGLIYLYLHFDYFIVTEGKLQVDGSRKLEILENLATDKVDAKGLTTLTNLRRLDVRIQENLEDLELVNNYLVSNHRLQYTTTLVVNCDFSSGEGLSLQIQLLECNCLVELYINGITGKLPEYDHHFCRSLAHLTLFGSHLKDDPMVTLEKLPNLKVLYLIKAFTWRVDGGAMPVLYSLFIASCENLKMLLDGLRFISTLHELNICDMSAAFNDRLSEGGEDFHKFRHIPHICFEYISPFVEEFQEVPTSILEPDKLSAHGSPQKLNKHSYGSTNASSVEHFLKESTAVS